MRILLADDNQSNLIVFGRYFQKLGYAYDLADNGLEAMRLMDENKYNLVILDCLMPSLSGYETAEMIRLNEIMNSLPAVKILALTALSGPDEINRSKKSGMDDHLSKPVTLDEMKKKILEMIGQ